MDTKKMAIFLEAVKTGSLKKAAEKMNYTQSGLIYLMNSLENEWGGVKLLNRTSKGVCLTQEGILLEPYIRRIVENENELLTILDELRNVGTKEIRIGTYPIYACGDMPKVVKSFLKNHPDNDIIIRVATNKELMRMLADDEIDIAIGEQPADDEFDYIPLFQYETYAAVPKAYKLEGEEGVTFEQLKQYPLLFSEYNQVSNQIEELLEGENPHKIHMDSSDGSALLRMVDEGMGIAFLSGLYLKECPDNVDMFPLEPSIRRELGVIGKKNRMKTPLVKSFIPYVKKVAKTAKAH